MCAIIEKFLIFSGFIEKKTNTYDIKTSEIRIVSGKLLNSNDFFSAAESTSPLAAKHTRHTLSNDRRRSSSAANFASRFMSRGVLIRTEGPMKVYLAKLGLVAAALLFAGYVALPDNGQTSGECIRRYIDQPTCSF
jgi:hypothetical protein